MSLTVMEFNTEQPHTFAYVLGCSLDKGSLHAHVKSK